MRCARAGVCDVACVEDADCAVVSGSHFCDQGACRAQSTLVRAEQLLIIGDNMFAGPNQVGAELEAEARSAGIIEEDEALNDHSSPTTNALAYMGGGISDQYVTGNPEGQVRLVIMNGGGVDAVFGSCDEALGECPVLAAAALAAEQLLEQMAADGVENVLYAFYPDPGNPGQKERVDALRPLIQSACAEAPVACNMLDLRPIFEGHYDEYVVPDGLTEQGSRPRHARSGRRSKVA